MVLRSAHPTISLLLGKCAWAGVLRPGRGDTLSEAWWQSRACESLGHVPAGSGCGLCARGQWHTLFVGTLRPLCVRLGISGWSAEVEKRFAAYGVNNARYRTQSDILFVCIPLSSAARSHTGPGRTASDPLRHPGTSATGAGARRRGAGIKALSDGAECGASGEQGELAAVSPVGAWEVERVFWAVPDYSGLFFAAALVFFKKMHYCCVIKPYLKS